MHLTLIYNKKRFGYRIIGVQHDILNTIDVNRNRYDEYMPTIAQKIVMKFKKTDWK